MARTQITNTLIKNQELTGASMASELGFYDETRSYNSGDSVIWQNEKYTCNTNITGTTEGDLSNAPDLSADWDKSPNPAYSVYPSASEGIPQTRINLTLDTERYSSPYCSLSGSEITILSSGTFVISASFAVNNNTTTRCSASGFIQLDTGSGFADIPNFEINVYSRNSTDAITTGSMTVPISFNPGDKLRFQAVSNNDTAISSYTNGCNITIFGLDAVSGPRGSQGIAGPSGDLKWMGTYSAGTYNQYDTVEYLGSCYTCLVNGTTTAPPGTPGVDWDLVASKGSDGAGATLTVADSSVNLANTPHGTLNFTGDITATDGGSGIANVDVTFPKNSYMVPIYAEENSSLSDNTFEYSFGNGATTPSGNGLSMYVPSGYKCELVAMSLVLRQGTATVSALKNSTVLTNAEVSVNSGQSNTAEFTPVEYINADIINFKTKVASGTGGPNVVTAWFKYTEI